MSYSTLSQFLKLNTSLGPSGKHISQTSEMPPRVPTKADFEPIELSLPHVLHFPSPPESTTTILILLHGLGDTEVPFGTFARSVNLPGVLAISVRGVSPLPPSLLPSADDARGHFHWGDDINMDPAKGDLDEDPGFDKASEVVMSLLVKDILINKCGWEWSDVLFFGFGQGGSLALGIAATLAAGPRVAEITGPESATQARTCKGVVSIGGPLPPSMVSSVSSRKKSSTPVLLCQVEDEARDYVRREFADVAVVQWKRRDVAMPSNREEMFPIMKFLADRLNSGW